MVTTCYFDPAIMTKINKSKKVVKRKLEEEPLPTESLPPVKRSSDSPAPKKV